MSPDQIMKMESFPMLVQSVQHDGIGDLILMGTPLSIVFAIWLVVLLCGKFHVESAFMVTTFMIMVDIVLIPVIITNESYQKTFGPEGYVLLNYEKLVAKKPVCIIE